jgi:hypothetical protein
LYDDDDINDTSSLDFKFVKNLKRKKLENCANLRKEKKKNTVLFRLILIYELEPIY